MRCNPSVALAPLGLGRSDEAPDAKAAVRNMRRFVRAALGSPAMIPSSTSPRPHPITDTTSAKASSYPRQLQFALKTRGAHSKPRTVRYGRGFCMITPRAPGEARRAVNAQVSVAPTWSPVDPHMPARTEDHLQRRQRRRRDPGSTPQPGACRPSEEEPQSATAWASGWCFHPEGAVSDGAPGVADRAIRFGWMANERPLVLWRRSDRPSGPPGVG